MASAGRILIMPKGNWDAEAEYEMLDLVKYDGKTWLSKKGSIGIEPSAENEAYWMDMFDITAKSFFLTKTYSGTTDANGFLKPKELTVDTTDIVSCGIVNGPGFCTPFNDTDAHWSFKFENWDRSAIANTLATVKVIYMHK